MLEQVDDFVADLQALTAKLQKHRTIRFHRQLEPLYKEPNASFRTGIMAVIARELSDEPALVAFERRWRVVLVPDLVVGGPLELGFIDDHYVFPVMLLGGIAGVQWFLARHERTPDRFAIIDRRAITNDVLDGVSRVMDNQGKKVDSREPPYELTPGDLERDPKIVAYCWPRRHTKIAFSDLAASLDEDLAKKLKYDPQKKRIGTGQKLRIELNKKGDVHHDLVQRWELLVKRLRERWPQLQKVLEFK